MRKSWKGIFIFLLLLSSLCIVGLPLFIRINFVKLMMDWWIKPIKNYLDAYFALIGTIVGSSLTISGAMWQSEKNVNDELNRSENKILNYLLAEINTNHEVIKIIYEYFESNNIKQIVFYPDDYIEFWDLKDGSIQVEVDCKNNFGIIKLKLELETSRQFLIRELFSIENTSNIEDLYDRLQKIKLANGFDYKFVKDTYSKFIDVQQMLKNHIETLRPKK